MPSSESPLSPTVGLLGLKMVGFRVKATGKSAIFGVYGPPFADEKFTLPTLLPGESAGCFAIFRKNEPKLAHWVVMVAQGGVKWGMLVIEGASWM